MQIYSYRTMNYRMLFLLAEIEPHAWGIRKFP